MAFDTETRALIEAAYEVRIETVRLDGATRRTIIWIMVDGEDVFVRSVRGDRGHWFQAAMDETRPLVLICGKQSLPVKAVLADDQDTVARVNRAARAQVRQRPGVVHDAPAANLRDDASPRTLLSHSP